MPDAQLLDIATGRLAAVRLGPNEDLTLGLKKAAAALGFRRALVRSGLGSLLDAALQTGTTATHRLRGPAIEILSMSGEIALEGTEAAGISGVVGDTNGAIWAGLFLVGENPVCVTVEAVLEEILDRPTDLLALGRATSPRRDTSRL
jgi:predicted DNA-binding protein with PD1-like motif